MSGPIDAEVAHAGEAVHAAGSGGARGGVDAALVARLGRGDRDAVAALHARFARPLFAYVRDLVGDATLAEEIVQDTFVAAWRGAGRFEARSSVSSWLFGIARRQARDRMRRTRPEVEPFDRLDTVAADDPEPEAAALAAASRADLVAALDRLPPQQREVLLLAFGQELSGPEIAGVLGIPEGTVKSRLFNARRALRAALSGSDVR